MPLVWIPRARRHLMEISAHIAQDNPEAARTLVDRIRDGVARLDAHPELGRIGRITGTRELVITGTRYIAVYRVRGRTVRVVALLHSSQHWPDRL